MDYLADCKAARQRYRKLRTTGMLVGKYRSPTLVYLLVFKEPSERLIRIDIAPVDTEVEPLQLTAVAAQLMTDVKHPLDLLP